MGRACVIRHRLSPYSKLSQTQMLNINIRQLNKDKFEDALQFSWKVFLEYDASDYSQEGLDEFYKTIHSENFLSKLSIFGAFLKEELIGVIATRNENNVKHISLFFVDGKYQGQGVGKQLFQSVKTEKMIVHSSPYAVIIYQKLGFKALGTEQIVNGLRFTPMEYC